MLAGCLGACNSAGCLDNGSALPLAGFYDSSTGKSVTIHDVEIVGIGAPNDSVLHAASQSATQVYLPMRSTADQTSWLFSYIDGSTGDAYAEDVVTFDYEPIPYFASEECGAMYVYRITGLNYTKNLIDSIALFDSLITNVELERIKIFFRSAPEEEAAQ